MNMHFLWIHACEIDGLTGFFVGVLDGFFLQWISTTSINWMYSHISYMSCISRCPMKDGVCFYKCDWWWLFVHVYFPAGYTTVCQWHPEGSSSWGLRQIPSEQVSFFYLFLFSISRTLLSAPFFTWMITSRACPPVYYTDCPEHFHFFDI